MRLVLQEIRDILSRLQQPMWQGQSECARGTLRLNEVSAKVAWTAPYLDPETTVADMRDAARMLEKLGRTVEALRGGNGDRNNAQLLRWVAERLVEKHGENPSVDYIRALRERAGMIEAALLELGETP